MLQGKRDVDTVLTMGIMEDVSIIPQPAGGEIMLLFLICIRKKGYNKNIMRIKTMARYASFFLLFIFYLICAIMFT